MPDCSNLVIGDTAPACATQNTGDATTRLTRNGDTFNTALEVVNQNGEAIYGESTNGVGVFGSTDSSFRVGVSGEGGSGVFGFGRADAPDQPSPGVIGRGNQNGVIGEVDSSDGIGVTGYGGLNGAGVVSTPGRASASKAVACTVSASRQRAASA
jgi:hypothetical protein